MIELVRPAGGTLCDRLTRRRVLEVGALSGLGLALPQLLRADTASTRPRAKSVILVFLNGGPSHLDMWDMKPEAPAEIRGEFKPISTNVPGIQVSEHLPRLAKQADRYALIRSAYHKVSNAHAAAVYTACTGDDRGDTNVAVGADQRDFPSIGSLITHQQPTPPGVVPYVSLPYVTKEGAGGPPQPGYYGGWLGRAYDPLFVLKDPNAPDFAIPELTPPFGAARIAVRKRLLDEVDRFRESLQVDNGVRGMGAFQQRALALLTSPATRKAFDIGQEPAAVREAYGRNIYGQSLLLGRRLIESGCRMVALSWAPDANATWDTHGNNFVSLRNSLLPQLDACLSSLLNDLADRALLESTLVVCMGEFGRTPKVNNAAGRDHWPHCYSLLVAGGGVKGGRVVGASDSTGAEPAQNPVTPQDIVWTILTLLGVDPELELLDPFDRPLKVVNGRGRFIQELV